MELYRIRTLCSKIGLSKSTIYEMVKSGNFPEPLKIGKRAVAWKSSDVDNWIFSREKFNIWSAHA